MYFRFDCKYYTMQLRIQGMSDTLVRIPNIALSAIDSLYVDFYR